MKAKYFLIGFMILILGAFCATVNTRTADYELGISPGDEIVREITVVDEEGLEDLYEGKDLEDGGDPWEVSIRNYYYGAIGVRTFNYFNFGDNMNDVGAKCKFKLDWINESDNLVVTDKTEDPDEKVEVDAWGVYCDNWYWIDPDNDFNPEPDYNEAFGWRYQDPDDLNNLYYNDVVEESYLNINYLGGWCFLPTPVDDYIDELDWAHEDTNPNIGQAWNPDDDMEWEWDSDGNMVTFEGSFAWDDDGDWEYEDFTEEWTYDETTGAVSLYQLKNDDDEVLYEISIVSAIPGYELPILLGVTTAFTIGLIYVIRKRTK